MEYLEQLVQLQKQYSALMSEMNTLVKAHTELTKECIEAKKEIMKLRGIVYSSPSLN